MSEDTATRARTDDQLARVARLHYEHGMTHQEIADLLGVSRVKVTRQLAESRRVGIVEITIRGGERPLAAQEDRLKDALGLSDVWLAPTTDEARTRATLASVGAACLGVHLARATVLTVGLSETVGSALRSLASEQFADLTAVPMAGGWGGLSRGSNPDELVARLAALCSAQAFHLPAPLLAGDAAQALALGALPSVAESIAIAARADTAVFGIGASDWSFAPLAEAVSDQERAQLAASGAVGDVSGRFYDATGRGIEGDLDSRVVGLALTQLRAVPTRIAVAHGRHKIDAIRGALAGGLVSVLVTDSDTAEALIG